MEGRGKANGNKIKDRVQIPGHNMRRSSSSNSESQAHLDSPHSPLRFHSPLRSDQGDPDASETPYTSPEASPGKPPQYHEPDHRISKAIVAADKSVQYSTFPPMRQENNSKEEPARSPVLVVNRAVREHVPPAAAAARKVGPEGGRSGTTAAGAGAGMRWSGNGEMTKVAELGFRICGVVLCLISFSVMAADKTQGWSGDSFDRYKEYRYCLCVNVIGFVYSMFQTYDLSYFIATRKHVMRHRLRRHFNFFMDQTLAYLLISSASSAATRVDDWQSNWGKDDFTKMASASVAMAFLAFVAFATSSLLSAYNLYNHDSA